MAKELRNIWLVVCPWLPAHSALLGSAMTAGVVCKVFSYTMIEDAPQYQNILWTCRGQIMFQSSGFTTNWHGTCDDSEKGFIHMCFHYKGKDKRYWKTANVMQVSPGAWKGFDYKCRKIEMKLIETLVYQPSHTESGWIVLGDDLL